MVQKRIPADLVRIVTACFLRRLISRHRLISQAMIRIPALKRRTVTRAVAAVANQTSTGRRCVVRDEWGDATSTVRSVESSYFDDKKRTKLPKFGTWASDLRAGGLPVRPASPRRVRSSWPMGSGKASRGGEATAGGGEMRYPARMAASCCSVVKGGVSGVVQPPGTSTRSVTHPAIGPAECHIPSAC
jgi:hypothetical protein